MPGVKSLLKRTTGGLRLPIMTGHLRGCWWLPASGGKTVRVLLGNFERVSSERFVGIIEPGDIVFDIGAHVGYYTLLGARAMGAEGTVVAFEPAPRNAEYLRRHARINRLDNVIVEECAVADTAGTASFAEEGSGTGHLAERGALSVEMVTLDGFVADRSLPPNVMKMDVEGAEGRVLAGGRSVLADVRPRILLSTHGPDVDRECRVLLAEHGYEIEVLVEEDQGGGSELLCMPG